MNSVFQIHLSIYRPSKRTIRTDTVRSRCWSIRIFGDGQDILLFMNQGYGRLYMKMYRLYSRRCHRPRDHSKGLQGSAKQIELLHSNLSQISELKCAHSFSPKKCILFYRRIPTQTCTDIVAECRSLRPSKLSLSQETMRR